MLWAGTDDGLVQVSRDDNRTWTEVSGNVPGEGADCWVSRVEASHFDPATAYVSFDCHRSGDLRPHLYVTRDYGATWRSIAAGLPSFGNVNVVQQDPRNPLLLYVGTEFGFYVSLDEGGSWDRFMTDLPTVRVDDVVVHPRDGDLVLGTHGRGALVLDDVTPLQQWTPEILDRAAHLFEPREAVLWRVDGTLATGIQRGEALLRPEPGAGDGDPLLPQGRGAAPVRITVTDAVSGRALPHDGGSRRRGYEPGPVGPARERTASPPRAAGAHPPPWLRPGSTGSRCGWAGQELTRTVRVVDDVWMEPR